MFSSPSSSRPRLALSLFLSLVALVAFVAAAPPSRFSRPIDERKLEKDYEDAEDDEWHEDTYEWKRKEAQKKQAPIDFEALAKKSKGNSGMLRDTVLQNEAGSGNMQMAFATIRASAATEAKAINEIGSRWQAMLATNSVQTKMYPIGGQDVLFTEDNGRIMEVRDFVLNQPECEKFRWKDTDFTPTPTAQPTQSAKKGKKAKAAKEPKSDL